MEVTVESLEPPFAAWLKTDDAGASRSCFRRV
jgi:hypothetical protein